MAKNKTAPPPQDPAAYIAALQSAQLRDDCQTLCALLEHVTGHKAAMWGSSIIGFGSYHYRYESGREGESMLAGFSPRQREMSIYLMGRIPDQAQLLDKLGKHRMGKACLYIKSLKDIDLDVLAELVAKSVEDLRKRYPSQK